MSYQASYSTTINTRIASDALKNIGRNIIQMAEGIRVGSEKCTVAMDALMNKRSGFLIDVSRLKTEYRNCYNNILKDSSSITISEAKIKAISEIPGLRKFAEDTTKYKAINHNQELIKGREGKRKIDAVIEESFTLIEKSLVDIQTVLVTKVLTDCKWKITSSATEINAQSIVAQNKDGNVVGLNITGDKIDFDISGYCDSTCVEQAKILFEKLDGLGLKSRMISGFRHNKPSGGILLSESKDAKKIIKKAKNKIKKAVKVSIPLKVSDNESFRNKTQQKVKEI